jgi:hypothetical protein
MSDPKLHVSIDENAHERDKLIEFDEPTHKYTINGEEGVCVTTFLHGHFDHFDSDKIIAGILKE